MLLVDAEELVRLSGRAHLKRRDGWNLSFAPEPAEHLMVQTTETWIVADLDALAAYYGAGFRRGALPNWATDLEALHKNTLFAAFERSNRYTVKRECKKIRDGRAILVQIDPAKVRARRPACKRLFETLNIWIMQA